MISSSLAYLLLLITLSFFAWLGYQESLKATIDNDSFLSARNSQNWVMTVSYTHLRAHET